MIFSRSPKPRKIFAADALAARAIYQLSPALHTIESTIRTADGEVIKFEMDIRVAGRYIEQLMSAYNAIAPPLKTSRGGFGL